MFRRLQFPLLLFCIGHLLTVNSLAQIELPGDPKPDLHVELLQSRAYCRTMEMQIENIRKIYPNLAIQAVAADAAWKTSPFAKGARNIEADIRKQTKGEGNAMLEKIDAQLWEQVQPYIKMQSQEDALDFLTLVGRRAKGEIEVEMVRGNLLWQYPPYQEKPELEFTQGYTTSITHPQTSRVKVTFQRPMSWKIMKQENEQLLGLLNCYGHGNVWCTVVISPLKAADGTPLTADERYAAYNQEGLAEDYKTLGITLKSFTKTKLNGMPALMFTREQIHEQLGSKTLRAAEVIRVFHKGCSISFQINTLGPVDSDLAEKRIQRNDALFKQIAGSVRIE